MTAHPASPPGLFVTGTDTGVGKSRVTAGLIEALRLVGVRAGGMKPVAAGGTLRDGILINDDTALIAQVSAVNVDLDLLCPYSLPIAASPHIAAEKAGISIELDLIAGKHADLGRRFEFLLVEGAGGWLTPIDRQRTMADLAARLGLPVLLVVGLRLGCLSHAALTAEAIQRRGLPLAGWVASAIDPAMDWREDNLTQLERQFGIAPLAVLPFAPERSGDARHLAAAAERLASSLPER